MPAPQVEQHIGQQLPRAVVRHLPAAIDIDHGNAPGGQQVFTPGVHPEGKNRRVLQQPDLVRGVRIARLGERLHIVPDRYIVTQPQVCDLQRGRCVARLRLDRHHSTISNSSQALNSR